MTQAEPAPVKTAHESAPRLVWGEREIGRALSRMAHQIIEDNGGGAHLVLLGIPTRGVLIAKRLAAIIGEVEGITIPVGELDITMYRDDLRKNPTRAVGRTRIPQSIDDAIVVLVDDVLYSGRTVAAAMDAIKDLGRPQAIRLAVLVDRGHRELPIQPDHVGKDLPTGPNERVRVRMRELDGQDLVAVVRTTDGGTE